MQEVSRLPAMCKDKQILMVEGSQRFRRSLTQRMKSAQSVKGDQIKKGLKQDRTPFKKGLKKRIGLP